MKAAYVRAPFQFAIRVVEAGAPGDDEVLVDVRSCGVSGTDQEAARVSAREWRPFGHEVAGVVAAVGRRVTDLKIGQKVLSGASEATGPAGGFAELTIVPAPSVVPFEGISFTAAALVSTLGVALELVEAAGIRIGDDVLVVGAGAVGLMALRLARSRGARRLWVAQRTGARRRQDLALEMGADEILPVEEDTRWVWSFPRGGVDRVIVTSPPSVLPHALRICRDEGTVAFVGTGYGESSRVEIDATDFRCRGLTLRGTRGARPELLGRCVDLIRGGMINAERLVSHTFQLEELPQAFRILRDDRQNRVKLVMVKD